MSTQGHIPNNVVVAIVGMPGAGKSIAAKVFVQSGFQKVRFGQVTIDLIKAQGLEINEANERKVREACRAKHGMAAYAILNMPKINQLLQIGPVVVDGLYSWSEYKLLKETFGDRFHVVAVYAPPKVRYARLEDREAWVGDVGDTAKDFRSIDCDTAASRDYAEIENLEKGGPIAMADFLIKNDRQYADFIRDIQETIKYIIS